MRHTENLNVEIPEEDDFYDIKQFANILGALDKIITEKEKGLQKQINEFLEKHAVSNENDKIIQGLFSKMLDGPYVTDDKDGTLYKIGCNGGKLYFVEATEEIKGIIESIITDETKISGNQGFVQAKQSARKVTTIENKFTTFAKVEE